MESETREQATRALTAHAQSIDQLHQKLVAMPGVDAERLRKAVGKYKAAHEEFRDDALGCMN